MARTFPTFKASRITRYLVLWDPQWRVLDCQYLEPGADLSGAMAAAIDRLAADGWQAEGGADYGFVFLRCQAERRLLMLTPRDPYNATAQSFSPFNSPR